MPKLRQLFFNGKHLFNDVCSVRYYYHYYYYYYYYYYWQHWDLNLGSCRCSYHMSLSASPFYVMNFFEIGSYELFVWDWI
jgi:hypothetical protein